MNYTMHRRLNLTLFFMVLITGVDISKKECFKECVAADENVDRYISTAISKLKKNKSRRTDTLCSEHFIHLLLISYTLCLLCCLTVKSQK